MSSTMVHEAAVQEAVTFKPELYDAGTAPCPASPQRQDRRRPGRIENPSPELIALMRRPASAPARVKVALYDAPGFLLPVAVKRPPRPGRTKAVLVAIVGSSIGWAAAFNAMMWAWG